MAGRDRKGIRADLEKLPLRLRTKLQCCSAAFPTEVSEDLVRYAEIGLPKVGSLFHVWQGESGLPKLRHRHHDARMVQVPALGKSARPATAGAVETHASPARLHGLLGLAFPRLSHRIQGINIDSGRERVLILMAPKEKGGTSVLVAILLDRDLYDSAELC